MNITQNNYQTTLYNDLATLVAKSEAFFFNDWTLDDVIYRNFSYRLASYTDFCEANALECRGIMFEITEVGDNAEMVKLSSIGFPKFHNIEECPFTMNLDLSQVVEIADKADGSLITTYMHYGVLQTKTKGSLTSDQAINANVFLHLEENAQFKMELLKAEQLGYTVICEWVSSDNRIVLPYFTPELRVLGIRSRMDGSFFHFADIDSYHFPEILKRWTKIIKTDDPQSYINSIKDMQGIEGVVARLPSGQYFKVKTSWYLALHHTKDSINTPRRLYEAVLEEATDDMRSLFHDDPLAIKLIADMEALVEKEYNHLVDTVERYYERNKGLDRKSYAILGQSELTQIQFGVAMMKYIEREFSYKDIMKKRWKEFGLKDEKELPNEDS